MESEKQEEEKDGVVVVELKVSMHCNACERSVANTIAKFKGVEKFITDMRRHRVVIFGKVDPKKVMKKLKKKTGKRVELVPPKQEEEMKMVASDGREEEVEERGLMKELVLFGGSHWTGCDLMTIFSDENVNACLVM